jgi:hypothetical protein
MTKAQHTPGPWEIEDEPFEPTHAAETYTAIGGKGWGAHTLVVTRMDGKDKNSPEGEANARLIAEAPAMLDALRGLLEPAERRWRALPKTSYEKKAIGAAQAILSRIGGAE